MPVVGGLCFSSLHLFETVLSKETLLLSGNDFVMIIIHIAKILNGLKTVNQI